ncbi:MAG: hypothetical protein J1E16_09565 [Muribaculaceae bacterium]|nr:hypothetical protein [Muribaculaceae bacterium]
MKWIVVFEDGKQQPFLRLDESEVKELIKILKDPYKKALRKLEKYQDIHESGEATERQENILLQTEELVRLMDNIINI